MEQIKKVIELIKDKELILLGEIHGTKEIPNFISKLFSEILINEDFNVCMEIPVSYKENIEDFFKKGKEDSDGRNSVEYLNLIKNLQSLKKHHNRNIQIFYIDSEDSEQNEREKGMAENILKNLHGKKTFVIMGNIHTSKKPILFNDLVIYPTGFILNEKLNGKIFCIKIAPSKGKFYNFGIKDISLNKKDNSNKYDYLLDIGEVTPCSFLKGTPSR